MAPPRVRLLETNHDDLVVPSSVVPEAAYLLLTQLGPAAERQLVQSVLSAELVVKDLTIADYRRTLELLRRYESARLGFVDATVTGGGRAFKDTAYPDNGSPRFLYRPTATLQSIRTITVTRQQPAE